MRGEEERGGGGMKKNFTKLKEDLIFAGPLRLGVDF